ncbi:IS110 family transposase [Mycetohabitans sp. B7]|nr:IS110 family transposase [Mycetohabitans sp. B7]
MRFVEPRTQAQQLLAALHRVRESLVVERTATINRIHAILLEFGIVVPLSRTTLRRLPDALTVHDLPPRLIQLIYRLHSHYLYLDQQVDDVERELTVQLREDENAARLLSIPAIGAITASLLVSEVGNVAQFEGGRNFAASIGLVPRQHSTGGRSILCGISKRGDKHLRHLLVQGARAVNRLGGADETHHLRCIAPEARGLIFRITPTRFCDCCNFDDPTAQRPDEEPDKLYSS